MPTVRPAADAKFVLDIEEETAGWLTSAKGGLAAGTVVETNAGTAGIPDKQLGTIAYEDLVLRGPLSVMSKAFYAWLRAVADRTMAARKSGAAIVTDAAGHERRRLSFANGLLTEITFPAADTASRDAASFTLRVQPESARVVFPGAGKIVITPTRKKQKLLAASNFRFTLGDLPTKRVTKVELPKLTAKVAAEGPGDTRDVSMSIRFDLSAFDVEIAGGGARPW
ncbi:MAG: hypothetical protein FJX78_02080 [Armatimonadetes bacterium]|nr:hypothetical protein [Armatimonadota bacterium]